MTSLLSAFCCRFLATSSRAALQVLSTRHGFIGFGKSHPLSLLACGAAGGGFSTITCVVAGGDFRPRESVQVALTVIGPADAPVVLSVAVLPLPEMLPLLAVQSPTVTGTLLGLVQVQLMVEDVPV
jgi:hypothetical protein